MSDSKAPLVVPTVTRKEKLIGIVVAVVVFAVILGGVLTMGSRVSGNNLTGTILVKTEEPVEEVDIKIGKSSFSSKSVSRRYILEVDVNGKVYLVPVPQHVFEAKKVGEKITFTRPPGE